MLPFDVSLLAASLGCGCGPWPRRAPGPRSSGASQRRTSQRATSPAGQTGHQGADRERTHNRFLQKKPRRLRLPWTTCWHTGEKPEAHSVLVDRTIYCAPDHAESILLVDTEAETARGIPVRTDRTGSKWRGAAAANSTVFFTPDKAPSILVLDVRSEAWRTIPTTGLEWEAGYGFAAVIGPWLYALPYNAEGLLMFQTATEELSALATTGIAEGPAKWEHGAAVGRVLVASLPVIVDVALSRDPLQIELWGGAARGSSLTHASDRLRKAAARGSQRWSSTHCERRCRQRPRPRSLDIQCPQQPCSMRRSRRCRRRRRAAAAVRGLARCELRRASSCPTVRPRLQPSLIT